MEIECPHLLEGLYEPDNFIGWKRTLKAAGLTYRDIRIFPSIACKCRICGTIVDDSLHPHLASVHGISAKEYRAEFPDAEVRSEAVRSGRLGIRRGKRVKVHVPHWEPAWSWRYILDRVYEYYETGMDVSYTSIAKFDAGLGACARAVFGSWDATLQAIGLNPDAIRKAKAPGVYHRDKLLKELKKLYRKDKDALLARRFAVHKLKKLTLSIFREFKTYESAIEELGLDPGEYVPGLKDVKLVRLRGQILRECRRRIKERTPYAPAEVATLLVQATPVIQEFYGTWTNLAASIGAAERSIFNPPSFEFYDSKEKVIRGVKERANHGLPMHATSLRVDNSPLSVMATKHFGTVSKAMRAAGVEVTPRMLSWRDYKDREEVIDGLQKRQRDKESLYASDVIRLDHPLHKWAIAYFGSYQAALHAAGINSVTRKPKKHPEAVRYPTAESVFAGIAARKRKKLSIERSFLMVKLKEDGGDKSLVLAGCRFFGSWKKTMQSFLARASGKI